MNNKEYLYGIHPVLEALKAGRREIGEVFFTKEKKSKRLTEIATIAKKKKIKLTTLSPSQLSEFVGNTVHQGVVARSGPFPFTSLESILSRKDETALFVLLLDNINDPQNLGALIRTALCVGVDGVIIPKDRSAQPSPAVSKASAGALEHISLVQVINMVQVIELLKSNGLWIAGLDAEGTQAIYAIDMKGPIGVVIGGEEKGIRPLVKKKCDYLVAVPQRKTLNSLNASVAGAVVMYEVLRQRL